MIKVFFDWLIKKKRKEKGKEKESEKKNCTQKKKFSFFIDKKFLTSTC